MPAYRYEDLVNTAIGRGITGVLGDIADPEDGLCGAITVACLLSAEHSEEMLGGTNMQALYLPASATRAAYPFSEGQYVLVSWYNGMANDYRIMTSSGETVRLFGWYTNSYGENLPADVVAFLAAALWLCPPVPELAGKEVAPEEED